MSYETTDARFSVVAWALGAMALMAVVVALVSWVIWRGFSASPRSPAAGAQLAPRLPPEPRLQADPLKDREALRQYEDSLLYRYAWVNRSKGIVQIPIERAMDLLAGRGLPAREKKENS